MNNIGLFDFTEDSRLKLRGLAELLNEQVDEFTKKALYYISAKTLNATLKDADKSIIEGLKKFAAEPELLQSFYRTNVPESKIKEAFTEAHNFYIEKLIEECGGNYTEDVIEKIRALKF